MELGLNFQVSLVVDEATNWNQATEKDGFGSTWEVEKRNGVISGFECVIGVQLEEHKEWNLQSCEFIHCFCRGDIYSSSINEYYAMQTSLEPS